MFGHKLRVVAMDCGLDMSKAVVGEMIHSNMALTHFGLLTLCGPDGWRWAPTNGQKTMMNLGFGLVLSS